MDRFDNFKLKDTYMVETVTIKELLQSMDMVPDVISIDIEGYDEMMLGSKGH